MRNIEPTLSKKQLFLSRICFSVAVVLYGVLLLLAAFNLFNMQFSKLILPFFLLTAAILSCVLAFVQQNTLLLWITPLLVLSFSVLTAKIYSVMPLNQSYPVLFLAPPLGSSLCMLYTGAIKDHIKVIASFLPIAACFFVCKLIDVSFEIAIASSIIYLGIAAVIYLIINPSKGARK